MHHQHSESALSEAVCFRDVVEVPRVAILCCAIIVTVAFGFGLCGVLIGPIVGGIKNDVLLGVAIGACLAVTLVVRICMGLALRTPRKVEVFERRVRLSFSRDVNEFSGDQCVFKFGAAHQDGLGVFLGNWTVILIEAPYGLVATCGLREGASDEIKKILLNNGLHPKAEADGSIALKALIASGCCLVVSGAVLTGLQAAGGETIFVAAGLTSGGISFATLVVERFFNRSYFDVSPRVHWVLVACIFSLATVPIACLMKDPLIVRFGFVAVGICAGLIVTSRVCRRPL